MLLSLWQHCSRYRGHIAVFCSIAVLLISIKGRKHVVPLVYVGWIWRNHANLKTQPAPNPQNNAYNLSASSIVSLCFFWTQTSVWRTAGDPTILTTPGSICPRIQHFYIATNFNKRRNEVLEEIWCFPAVRSQRAQVEVAAKSLRSRKKVVILHQKDFRQVISVISDISWYFHRYIVGQSGVMGWRYLVGPVDGDVLLGFCWCQWDESQRGCMSRCNGIDLDVGSHCLKHCVFIFADFCYRKALFHGQPRAALSTPSWTSLHVYIGARIPS